MTTTLISRTVRLRPGGDAMRLMRGLWALPRAHFFAQFRSGWRSMRFCFLDESGAAELSDPGSHFVFLGLAIPGETWKDKDQQVTLIKRRYGLESAEIHTAWLARRYPEQEKIAGFEALLIAGRS